MKPNYTSLGFSDKMGPKLRKLIEHQLSKDIYAYGLIESQLKFDWSESCIEGHDTDYLDGTVENFSGINIFNEKDEHIAEGWMEFIHEPAFHFFIAYWEFIHIIEMGREVVIKDSVGIPPHIFKKIPKQLQAKYKDNLLVDVCR
ncbi:hypothetical protein [Metabacillus malikii]|nr:hypothetical protein [Metabacillus malikii]